jgi:azurin
VFLELPELRGDLEQAALGMLRGLPDLAESRLGLVMAIDYKLRSAQGVELEQVIHKTIHRLPGVAPAPPIPSNRTLAAAGITRAESAALHDGHSATHAGRSVAVDDTRTVEIRSSGVYLNYDVTEIRAKAGERLTIRYLNASEMVHNLVVVKAEADITAVGTAALAAHADEYIPKDQADRIVAHSKLAQPGETVLMEFTVPAAGVYPYICTFSGHFTVMQGRLIVTE